MKQILMTIIAVIAISGLIAAQDKSSLISLKALNQQASQKLKAQPNTPLADEKSEVCAGTDVLESGKTPNYVRAFQLLPNAAKPFAVTVRAYLYEGTISPETKMAMGARIAQIWGSVYPAVHMQRLLRSSDQGRKLLTALETGDLAALPAREQAAVRYADLLTRDVHGVSDAEFQKTRAVFNDSQIVELTMTTAFFNYFIRFCEGANLPLEKWALDEPVAKVAAPAYEAPVARVALVSNEGMVAAANTFAAAKEQAANPNGLGIGIANSQRAFLLVPSVFGPWRAYTTVSRDYANVSREIKLHVSFAISMANGCRYCTLHQVQGLRRLGVNPDKLMAMAKNDSKLTSKELVAVTYARKITREPAKLTAADYQALRQEFEDQGALEILLQCGNFAYMNRFTDGLRLPSEDEAVKIYLETYGKSYEDVRTAGR